MEDLTPEFVHQTMQWLLVYLVKRSAQRYHQQLASNDGDEFAAKNSSQVYFCRTLAMVYAENFALHRFRHDKLNAPQCREEFRSPLTNVYMLYGLWVVEKHLGTLYQSNYFTDPQQVDIIRQGILMYCGRIKGEALLLVETIAPPDWVLRSPIGHSNGTPLKNLYDAIVTEKSQERVPWWEELAQPIEPGSKSHLIQSKL